MTPIQSKSPMGCMALVLFCFAFLALMVATGALVGVDSFKSRHLTWLVETVIVGTLGRGLGTVLTAGVGMVLAIAIYAFGTQRTERTSSSRESRSLSSSQKGANRASDPMGDDRPTRQVFGRASHRQQVGSSMNAPQVDAMVAQFAEESQLQAEASQKVRTDEFRAHVERPMPPITEDGQTNVARALGAKLAIRHIFPPRLPQRSLSFIGGSPVIPTDGSFDWPMVHNCKGRLERLNFMAQIDCADIPLSPAKDLLPTSGYLYFFAPMSLEFGPDAQHFVTRYLPGPARKNWQPDTYLSVGKIADLSDDVIALRGTKCAYPKVEIELGWLEEPSDAEIEARRMEGLPHEVAEKVRAERAEAFLGPKRRSERRLTIGGSGSADWLLDEDFPTNRAMARTLRERIQRHCGAQAKILSEKLAALEATAEDDPMVVALSERKSAIWALHSRSGKAFAGIDWNLNNAVGALSEEERMRANAFLRELLKEGGLLWAEDVEHRHWRDKQVIHGWMALAAIKGAEAALMQEPTPDAAVIPSAIIESLALLHDAREHHMFGNGVIVQVAAAEMQDRYILLLQLGRDPQMDWLIGEMGPLQYWITPEDLAARRFENTVLTIEAY